MFYQFNEMEFLKKLVNMLDWKEEGSITVADGMNVIVVSLHIQPKYFAVLPDGVHVM